MSAFSFLFTPRSDDFAEASRAFFRKRSERLIWWIVAYYLPVTLLFAWVATDNSLVDTTLTIFVLAMIPTYSVGRIFVNAIPVEEKLLKSNRWDLDEDALTILAPDTEIRYPWQKFQQVYENADYYFLAFKGRSRFLFFSKKSFPDAAAERSARDFLQVKLGAIRSLTVGPAFRAALRIMLVLYALNVGLFLYNRILYFFH
jgi:hypothetical protein